MKVTREDSGALSATLTVDISKEDYAVKYKKELSDQARKSHMKGFRKGKTPAGLIRRMYGKSILVEVVNEILQKSVADYLKDENIDFLGRPLPVEDELDLDFNPVELNDFQFKFELGLAPSFDLKGVGEEDKVEKFSIVVTDDMVSEELKNARNRAGKRIEVEDNIDENDILTIEAKELVEGEIKEDGHESSFTVLVNMVTDNIKKDLLSKKKDDEFDFDIYKIEKDKDEEYVNKYLLKLDENQEDEEEKESVNVGSMFRGTIKNIGRVEPAALDEEFFNALFAGEDIKDEDAAREKIKEGIAAFYDRQADEVMYKKIQEKLMEDNDLSLPDEFLKKWLQTENENVSPEDLEKEYPNFSKNLKWKLIREKLQKKFEIEVPNEEVVQLAQQKIQGYFGYYQQFDQTQMNEMMGRLLSDPQYVESLYDEIQTGKIFGKLKKTYIIDKNEVSVEEFDETYKAIKEKSGN